MEILLLLPLVQTNVIQILSIKAKTKGIAIGYIHKKVSGLNAFVFARKGYLLKIETKTH